MCSSKCFHSIHHLPVSNRKGFFRVFLPQGLQETKYSTKGVVIPSAQELRETKPGSMVSPQ